MKLKNFALLLVLAALWGPSFFLIKIAVAEIPPISLVLVRVGLAAVILIVILRIEGRGLPRPGIIWGHIAVVALFWNSMPFVLLSWGEQRVDSALASILNGATPVFTALLAHFFTADDRLTQRKITGVVLALSGVTLLVFPTLLGGIQATFLGLLAIVAVSASYAIALVYTRRYLRNLPPLVAPTGQLLLATAYLLPFSLLIDRPFSIAIPSLKAIASVVGLAVFSTVLAFVLYYHLVRRVPATYLSTVTYLIPIFGVLLGVLALKESLAWNAYAGFALILTGVMIVNGVVGELGRLLPLPGRAKPAPMPVAQGPMVDDPPLPCG